jgi:hypothetical protein
VKTARIGLLTVAAIALAVPLAAEEITAPDSRWQNAGVSHAFSNDVSSGVSSGVSNDVPYNDVPYNGASDAASGIAATAPERMPANATLLAQATAQQPAPATAPTQNTAGQADTSSQTSAPSALSTQQTEADTEQRKKAEKQIKEQEHQRVLGVLPSFNVSYDNNAVSLTGWQKIRLAFRTSVDPVTFGVAFLVAGYHEGLNDVGFGWGVKGYAQRAGAAYLDTFDGNMIGNGILPALLHQDPRYFRLGHGSVRHRLLYAASTAFICKHDNTGKWEPNYSNIGGNIASGAISNLYYPGTNAGVGLTISNGLIQTAEGAAGSMFQEFWPDISRHLFHKDPTHGKDASASPQSIDKP